MQATNPLIVTHDATWLLGKLLVGSIKVEVKKKHISFGWNFSCFAAHLLERDRF